MSDETKVFVLQQDKAPEAKESPETIRDKVKRVNALLKAGEPNNITTDHKGYSGYSPQAIVDSMNAVFEFGEWGFDEIENNEAIRTEKAITFVANVRVWLSEGGERIPFSPTAWGEGTQALNAPGDARKSAQTDGLKKGLSYFSVGNRAYHGKLPNTREKR